MFTEFSSVKFLPISNLPVSALRTELDDEALSLLVRGKITALDVYFNPDLNARIASAAAQMSEKTRIRMSRFLMLLYVIVTNCCEFIGSPFDLGKDVSYQDWNCRSH